MIPVSEMAREFPFILTNLLNAVEYGEEALVITFEPVDGSNGEQGRVFIDGHELALIDKRHTKPLRLKSVTGETVTANVDDLQQIINIIRHARSQWGMVKIGQG